MECFSDWVISPERERYVAYATTNMTQREQTLQLSSRFDECHSVVVVFLNSGGDREDVGIKDDVLGWK